LTLAQYGCRRSTSPLVEADAVAGGVVIAFLAGVPPVLAASVGAAILLISRNEDRTNSTLRSLGITGLFWAYSSSSASRECGLVDRLLQFTERWNLHRPAVSR